MEFKSINSEIVYKGRAFTIRRDTLLLPDSRQAKYDIVEHVGSVVLLPVTTKGELLFVRQYRHAAGLDLLELPAGTLDEGEAPETCARREIREETGMEAGKLVHLGGFYLAPGYSTEYMDVYLAEELHANPLEADADEFLTVESLPIDQALELCEQVKIPDAKTLAALVLARPYLDQIRAKRHL